MMLKQQTHEGHKPQIVVVRTDHGWEVREQRDETIVRVIRHADWHRVERSVLLLERRDA